MNDNTMNVEAGTLALISSAEIDQQIATAHKFPRSLKQFSDMAVAMVTLSDDVASDCIYNLPRDGKMITGPSARFAEIIASAWGNSRAGARVVNEGAKFITAQGVFHDLERNVAITFEVQRRITSSKGKRYGDDMIGVTGNAAASIALRNAILKGVPKAFWQPIYAEAQRVLMGDVRTLSTRRESAMNHLGQMGITPDRVFAALNITGVEDISLGLLATLRGMLTAIKEGDANIDTCFPELPKRGAAAKLQETLDAMPEDSLPPTGTEAETETPDTTDGADNATGDGDNPPDSEQATPASDTAAPDPAPDATKADAGKTSRSRAGKGGRSSLE